MCSTRPFAWVVVIRVYLLVSLVEAIPISRMRHMTSGIIHKCRNTAYSEIQFYTISLVLEFLTSEVFLRYTNFHLIEKIIQTSSLDLNASFSFNYNFPRVFLQYFHFRVHFSSLLRTFFCVHTPFRAFLLCTYQVFIFQMSIQSGSRTKGGATMTTNVFDAFMNLKIQGYLKP